MHIFFLRSFPSVLMSWLCHRGVSSDSEFLATHRVYCRTWQVEGIIGRPLQLAQGGRAGDSLGSKWEVKAARFSVSCWGLLRGRGMLGARREGSETLLQGLTPQENSLTKVREIRFHSLLCTRRCAEFRIVTDLNAFFSSAAGLHDLPVTFSSAISPTPFFF